jgi:phosphoglycolate phosphatase-like HAD superfamily hydrolase
MIGDTKDDIRAGKRAGTKTIGALYGFVGPGLIWYKPDHLIEDIREAQGIVLGN